MLLLFVFGKDEVEQNGDQRRGNDSRTAEDVLQPLGHEGLHRRCGTQTETQPEGKGNNRGVTAGELIL